MIDDRPYKKKIIIRHNEIGYHIEGKPYWYKGNKIEPLYQTCHSYGECFQWLKENGDFEIVEVIEDGNSIDDIIAKEKEMSKTFQKIVNTQMVSEDVSLDEMHCGDSEIIKKVLEKYQEHANYHNQIANIMCKYQILQADYNARLKADMIGILQKLKWKIDNMPKYYPYTDHSKWYIDGNVFGAIQKEIDVLKENKDE